MDQRSIDFAKTASIDMMSLNNKVVNMRQAVKRAKVQLINKLCKNIRELKKKKGSEEQKLKNLQKAERLIDEIESMKKLKEDKVTKYALANTSSFAEISKITLKAGPRALARLSDHPVMAKNVTQFREEHPDWRDLSAFLLVKQTGRRFKTKKQKEKTLANSAENIQASETMTKAYIQKRFGEEGLKIAERRFERKRTRIKAKPNLKPEEKHEPSYKDIDHCEDRNVKSAETPTAVEGAGQIGKETCSNLSIPTDDMNDISLTLSKEKERKTTNKKCLENDNLDLAKKTCEDLEINEEAESASSDNQDDTDSENSGVSGAVVMCESNESEEDCAGKKSENDILESCVSKSLSKADNLTPQVLIHNKIKQSESVVKEFDLDEMTGAALGSSESEVEYSDSSSETESSDNEKKGSDKSSNSSHSDKVNVKNKKSSLKSKKKTKKKITDIVFQEQSSTSFFEGSGDTFFEGNHKSDATDDNQLNENHSSTLQKNSSDFEGSNRMRFSSMFSNTGIEDEEKRPFKYRRGQGGSRGGRGGHKFGHKNGSSSDYFRRGFKTDKHREEKHHWPDKGDRREHGKYRGGFNTDRGPKLTTDKSIEKRLVKHSDSSRSFELNKGTKYVPESKEKLHPSWEASRKRKAEQSGLVAFKGSKITFNDDD